MGNFTTIENMILETETLTLHEKMVYISLRRFMNNSTDTAFPGAKRLAKMSRMSERKVRECIKSLDEKGWVGVERRQNDTNLYTFLNPPVTLGPEQHAVPPAHHAVPPMQEVQYPPAHGADKQDLINKTNNNKPSDAVFQRLFNRYQSKGIIKHNKPTNSMKRAVNARLKDFTEEQLVQVIDNYATVVLGDDYWFTHKYGFGDLMREKDVLKFVDAADPLNNFRRQSFGQSVQTVPQPKRITDYESLYTAGED